MRTKTAAMPIRTTLKERSFSVRSVASDAAADFFTSATPRLMPEMQVLAHLPEREAGADEHPADRDGPDDVAVEVAREAGPVLDAATASVYLSMRFGPRKKTRSGTKSPHARRPPAKFSAPSSGPMM